MTYKSSKYADMIVHYKITNEYGFMNKKIFIIS